MSSPSPEPGPKAEPAPSGPRVLRLLPGGRTYADLVDGLLDKDPAAAALLYETFARRVNGLVRRLLADDPEHDDVVQQVFLQIIGSIDHIQDPRALRGWVDRVTVHTVRKELRRRKVRRLVRFMEAPPEPPAPTRSPHDQLVAQRFYEVLAGMRTEDRILVVLRFVDGCTLTEVANATGCSLATVKRRLARAVKRFRGRARRDFVLGDLVSGDSPAAPREDT